MGLSIIPKTSLNEILSNENFHRPSLLRNSQLPISDFVALYGLKLGDLRNGELGYFIAARALLKLVGQLSIPVATKINVGSDSAQNRPNELKNSSCRTVSEIRERFPTENFTIARAGANDLIRILRRQYNYPIVQIPFLLASGRLQKLVMLSDESSSEGVDENRHNFQESDQSGDADDTTQRSYLLLDVSQSMNGEIAEGLRTPDKRGVVARGLGLAFLCEAKDRGSLLHFRPFSTKVGNRKSAATPQELDAITLEIIRIKNAGRTALQGSMNATSEDLSTMNQSVRRDVMLISDGVSYLDGNSTISFTLHTFLIGNFLMSSDERDRTIVERLRNLSTTFTPITCIEFPDILRPRQVDLIDFIKDLNQILHNLELIRNVEELHQYQKTLELAGELREMLNSFGSPNSELSEQFEDLFKKAKNGLENPEVLKAVIEREAEFQRICKLYDQHLPNNYRTSSDSTAAREDSSDSVTLKLFGNGKFKNSDLGLLFREIVRRVKKLLLTGVSGAIKGFSQTLFLYAHFNPFLLEFKIII